MRHRDRHTTHGSQLQKRDNFTQAASTLAAATSIRRDDKSGVANSAPPAPIVSPSDDSSIFSPKTGTRLPFSVQSPSTTSNSLLHNGSHPNHNHGNSAQSPASAETHYQPPTPQAAYGVPEAGIQRSDSTGSYTLNSPKSQSMGMYSATSRHASYGSIDGMQYQNTPFSPSDLGTGVQGGNHHPASSAGAAGTGGMYSSSTAMVDDSASSPRNSNAFVAQQNLLHMSSLPPPLTTAPPALSRGTSTSLANAISHGLSALDQASGVVAPGSSVGADPNQESIAPYAYPVFGGETYNRSPFAMGDDFTAWLFNEQANNSSPIGYPSGMVPGFYPDQNGFSGPFYPGDLSYGSYFTNVVPQHPMSVTSIIDHGSSQSIMSEEKRQELLHLIATRFNETDNAAVKKQKDTLMDGNMDADNHILGLRMMQTYIGSYWYHSHAQLPILHKPTFAADKTPNLLLLAVMAIGASTLDKMHGTVITDSAAELANFLAWHLRWEIFMDVDFRPPAKLWVFQTLLHLEIYEKLYSTRALHERAHIHHDTTLTLMRRGSSLIGRTSFDSPPSLQDRPGRSATASGSNSASESGNVGEESWAHWIKTEATRRVAFAAFVLDSTHATMFGHSAKMVAHEMRLPLPCDEALWSATSAAEVARVQTSLQSNGIKQIMFLDGLKKTLNGQKVRTNAFGRTIIMAGLLSVSWHMNQRDLQVSSLGVVQALGGRDKWRSALVRSFDNWKRDFDDALATSSPNQYSSSSSYRQVNPTYDDTIFESRSVLHHLAHMASHVDIVDCQIFAGAGRLLGRSISPKDYSSAREKMTERWATKASARDATFYALKFLCLVLISDNGRPAQGGQFDFINNSDYSARDDFLLNRPWVLYFSALVVWSYGYALDGAINPPPPSLNTMAEQQNDMREFLDRVGGVRAPDDLDKIRDRNRCLGLLMVLRDSFSLSRWELLHEAANLLESCIEKLRGNGTGADSRGPSSALSKS